MTVSQQQALVSLLQDGDAATVGLVKGQLMQGGEACLADRLSCGSEALMRVSLTPGGFVSLRSRCGPLP